MRVDYIDHMGTDRRVVDAARVSFDKIASYYTDKENDKLLSYLARHGHWTPFAHPQITLRYTVPIFVARQEFKHIVGFARNEVSRRYVDDTPNFFEVEHWRKRPEDGIKQGSGGSVDKETNEYYQEYYTRLIEMAEECYRQMVDVDKIAPEQARMVLPQSMYTSYYITGSLAAYARFFNQRSDSHAQKEIQDLAHMVGDIIQPLYPVSWEALTSKS